MDPYTNQQLEDFYFEEEHPWVYLDDFGELRRDVYTSLPIGDTPQAAIQRELRESADYKKKKGTR